MLHHWVAGLDTSWRHCHWTKKTFFVDSEQTRLVDESYVAKRSVGRDWIRFDRFLLWMDSQEYFLVVLLKREYNLHGSTSFVKPNTEQHDHYHHQHHYQGNHAPSRPSRRSLRSSQPTTLQSTNDSQVVGEIQRSGYHIISWWWGWWAGYFSLWRSTGWKAGVQYNFIASMKRRRLGCINLLLI